MPLFSRSTQPATTDTTTTTTTAPRRGLFHRDNEDPSITAARQRVTDAEAAERDADRALSQARVAVREAREGVKRLEREAAEELVALSPSQFLYLPNFAIAIVCVEYGLTLWIAERDWPRSSRIRPRPSRRARNISVVSPCPTLVSKSPC